MTAIGKLKYTNIFSECGGDDGRPAAHTAHTTKQSVWPRLIQRRVRDKATRINKLQGLSKKMKAV